MHVDMLCYIWHKRNLAIFIQLRPEGRKEGKEGSKEPLFITGALIGDTTN